jgi:hypothetical protein
MILALSIFILILIFLILKKLGYNLSTLHLLLLNFVLKVVGLYLIGIESGEFKSLEYFLYFFVSFLIGLFFYSSINKEIISSIIRPKIANVQNIKDLKLEYIIITLIILFFITYHYIKLGVPLFSSETEILRFQASSSGLLGIPSRIVNFSIIFYFIYLLFMYYYKLIDKKNLFLFSLVPIITILLSGSKSSVIVIFELFMASYRFSSNRLKIKHFLFFFTASLIYFYYTFPKYQSLKELNILTYVLQRLTVINANTFDYIIDVFAPSFSLDFDSVIINDLIYPFNKLFGRSDVMTVNTILSSSFYNVKGFDFAVPVTPGIFGYYYLEFGFYGTIILSFLSAILYVKIYMNANKSVPLVKKTFFVFLEYMLYIAYSTGNPIYTFINYLVGALIIFVLHLFLRSFFSLDKGRLPIKIFYQI